MPKLKRPLHRRLAAAVPSRAYLEDPAAKAISEWREPQAVPSTEALSAVELGRRHRDGFFRLMRNALALKR